MKTATADRQIYLLCGGTSDERRVAVASAQNLASTLPTARIWFMDPRGKILEVSHRELAEHTQPYTRDFAPQSVLARFEELAEGLKALDPSQVVFFLALHGGESEDGTLQKIFEQGRFAYTGSDSVASYHAFQKELAKNKVGAAGVQLARGEVVRVTGRAAAQVSEQIKAFFKEYGPLILKPNASGSSFGLLKILQAVDLEAVVKAVCSSNFSEYLMEELIQGREFTCGVTIDRSGARLVALPASEVRMQSGRDFDFEGKYLGKGSEEITPAQVTAEVMSRIQEVALLSHQALGCFGYSRTDMIWQTSQDRLVFLETNTLPGMTRASFIPQQLEAAGYALGEFILVQLGLAGQRLDLGKGTGIGKRSLGG